MSEGTPLSAILHNLLVPPIIRQATEADLPALAEEMLSLWQAGDTILLSGDLGAGKTTFVRSVLRALGWEDPVRSPTFTLLQTYATTPPVLHADLYRLTSASGVGLEEYLEDHLCFIEWPDRLGNTVTPSACWQVSIETVDETTRRFTFTPPTS